MQHQDDRTIIKFLFKKPVAIHLPSFPDQSLMLGTFYPNYEKHEKQVGDMEVPVGYYNLGVPTELRLLNERPQRLPEHLEKTADADMLQAYKVDKVKAAALNNAICEEIRNRLDHYERNGIIEVIFDSFREFDKTKEEPKTPKKRAATK